MDRITIRDARYGDLAAIAHVQGLAFFDDPLFGDLIHPHRDQYPQDVDLWHLRRLRVNYWNYRWKWLVAVERDEAKGSETIVAVAQWSRKGSGGKSLELFALDPRNLLEPMSSLTMKVHTLIWPNRACNMANEDVLERSYPYYKHMWSGEREESWYLEVLGVHPDYQGRGIGRELVQWGLDRAAKDGVCASVISSKGKEPFYLKAGFDFELGEASMGEGNPMPKNVGGTMLWTKTPAGK